MKFSPSVIVISLASFLLAPLGESTKAVSHRDLTMAPPPRQEMYSELIYIEKDCRQYGFFPLETNRGPTFGVRTGDYQSFRCDLYEAAINFGQYGGDKVGETLWYCKNIGTANFDVDEDSIVAFTFQDVAIWDCTVTDYLGEPDDDEPIYIRNEGGAQDDTGLAPVIEAPFFCNVNITEVDGDQIFNGVLCDERRMRDDSNWREFHSHTGKFATIGGTLIAKGARGQLEVVWDFYKMTWFHIYNVEVWALEQPPIPLYGSGHKIY